MQIQITLFLLLLFSVTANAQKQFTTITPQVPVVAGEAFQVQYIVEDAEKTANLITPVFQGCRIVSGPNIYSGSVVKGNAAHQSKNFVFTLVASNPGKLLIPGAIISIDGKPVRSNNSFIEVISKEVAAKRYNKEISGGGDYFLRPGEDAQQKIKQNLFLKVWVDKKSCFVGEPVVAIYKLYSRLESKSDIVKNPGFYGFTVHDMVNLADKQVATEKVNGKFFDVHTIRKVQLYPLQAGVFTIDAMAVKNKVEFSRSIVNKKTEQEIIEGVLVNDEADEKKEDAEEFESSMSTEPITINVRPLPVNNKPASFNGATGLFNISAEAIKNKISKDEGDVLKITVSGKGNFVQLNAPVVEWPAGIEGFEPSIKDSLDKTSSPLTGSRTYHYPFTSSTSGSYTIPAVNFSFFNPDSGNYKTVTTSVLQVKINDKKTELNKTNPHEIKTTNKKNNYWLTGAVILLFSAAIFWFFKRKKIKPGKIVTQPIEKRSDNLSVTQVLAPASLLINADDQTFYSSLRQSIWNYFGPHFNLSGSEMTKDNIIRKLTESKVDESLITEMRNILQQCEAGIFTNANLSADKNILLDKTKKILEKMNESLL